MKVAVLGLGIMGAGVARTLMREGFEVTVWNRSLDKAKPLGDDGATVASSASEAVLDADAIVSILFDGDAVLEVLADAAGHVRSDAVWVQASTIGLDATKRVVAAAEQAGVRLVEAMMLGTKVPAEKGTLVMLAAGDDDLLAVVQPVLDAMGSKTVRAGGSVGQGTALKLAANAWIGSITAATAQSLAIAEHLGLDQSLFLEAIAGGQSDSQYAHVKGASMIAGEYPASFALDGLRKDLGLIDDAIAGGEVDARMLQALIGVYATASERGHGSDDIASVHEGFVPAS